MRTIEQALLEHDLIVLRVIAEWLGLDLTGADKAASAHQLAQMLAQVDVRQEMEYLEPEEQSALNDLVGQGGRVPVAVFERQHGEVRLMGPGRMEREEPWLDPISATESLWYRGFLYRGFDETPEGAIEFYFLPKEMLAQFSTVAAVPNGGLTTAVSPTSLTPVASVDPTTATDASADAVDDLTSLLALAQRTGLQPDKLPDLTALLIDADRERRSLLLTLADEMGVLRRSEGSLRPTRAALDWLQKSREAQLRAIVEAWSNSAWNDLCHTPGLICEGEGWQNDPILARTALLERLPRNGDWYRIRDIVDQMRAYDPDFQRPDGNYDTWYLRDAATLQSLSGFGSWDRVEGRLLRFLLEGPLRWLGMTETASELPSGEACYRLSDRALSWLLDEPAPTDEVRVPLVVQPDGTILVPYNAGRYERFQAARVADLEPMAPGKLYRYRITPASLESAKEQGIAPDRVVQFLSKASGRPVPASVQRGITRWSERGVEGRLQRVVVLRVGDEAILETLRTNPKTRDLIAESLGELVVVIRAGDWEAFRQATAQLGLLLDVEGV